MFNSKKKERSSQLLGSDSSPESNFEELNETNLNGCFFNLSIFWSGFFFVSNSIDLLLASFNGNWEKFLAYKNEI